MYGHVFKDNTGHYLFIDQLGIGVSCQSQLVLHCESGELRVRKVLHRRVRTTGILGRFLSTQTAAELELALSNKMFTSDVETAKKLTEAAQHANFKLRVPQCLSDATIPDPKTGKSTRVSYWQLCNGGSLDSLTHKCRQTDARLPLALVMRLLQHVLETLNFMYTALPEPLMHNDIHDGNILLHFQPGCVVPEFHLIDFGGVIPANSMRLNPRGEGAPEFWDMTALMGLINTRLMPVLSPEDRDGVRDLNNYTDHLANEENRSPICTVYRMLAQLDDEYRAMYQFAQQQGGPVRFPDMSELLCYVRMHAMVALPDLVLMHRSGSLGENVYGTNHLGKGVATKQPKLYVTVSGLLGTRNVPGPWYVAHVADGSGGAVEGGRVGGVQVVGIKGVETHHRPNEENANSVTDEMWCGQSMQGQEREECEDGEMGMWEGW